eukprot:CAMPEP_0203852608 /NCGR_PEP_ID=MMETSP0359-20131031/8032_1 /ASSEMBLY_ACC=CAM_ASM_000338 /TAXON_ID=268821 /ORGANISM="Scrippsiella Hangoei, Strain SHTV-5" /LENGTH=152 /DNA_ID=CAMNT_0050768801 /DNA_START=497 /DNA_END=956 /DNA_ORIENTATION=-
MGARLDRPEAYTRPSIWSLTELVHLVLATQADIVERQLRCKLCPRHGRRHLAIKPLHLQRGVEDVDLAALPRQRHIEGNVAPCPRAIGHTAAAGQHALADHPRALAEATFGVVSKLLASTQVKTRDGHVPALKCAERAILFGLQRNIVAWDT